MPWQDMSMLRPINFPREDGRMVDEPADGGHGDAPIWPEMQAQFPLDFAESSWTVLKPD